MRTDVVRKNFAAIGLKSISVAWGNLLFSIGLDFASSPPADVSEACLPSGTRAAINL